MEFEIRTENDNLFAKLGGKTVLQKVHKIFYDKLYAHSFFKQFFIDIDQQVIEDQQTDFMAQAMGGPRMYCGKFPIPAHKHMFITESMFEKRHAILKESIEEAQIDSELAQRWLKIDYSFKSGIVKNSIQDCEKRFASDDIIKFSEE